MVKSDKNFFIADAFKQEVLSIKGISRSEKLSIMLGQSADFAQYQNFANSEKQRGLEESSVSMELRLQQLLARIMQDLRS